ncbi:MAG: thiamine diphosphokinase [Patescibacteria group bacterium]
MALLVGGGEVDGPALARFLNSADVRIGVDGGALALEKMGAVPDWVIGDFDSLGPGDLARLEAKGARIRRYPYDKDETDLELGLALAAELAATDAAILGATGDRLDHTLTNLGFLLRAAELGLRAVLHAPGQEISLLGPGRTTFSGYPGRLLSLVPLAGIAEGVATEGLRYPLQGEDLLPGRSRGVHNEFLGAEAAVSLRKGSLLAFLFAPDGDNALPGLHV